MLVSNVVDFFYDKIITDLSMTNKFKQASVIDVISILHKIINFTSIKEKYQTKLRKKGKTSLFYKINCKYKTEYCRIMTNKRINNMSFIYQ